MNRRGFLQLLSAVGASIALPVPKFVLAEPLIVLPEMPVFLGGIRAMGFYDLREDRNIIRLDAYNGKDQFGVDFVVEGINPRESYLYNRKIAEEVLAKSIKDAGWKASDLIVLPITMGGYVEPEWMRA